MLNTQTPILPSTFPSRYFLKYTEPTRDLGYNWTNDEDKNYSFYKKSDEVKPIRDLIDIPNELMNILENQFSSLHVSSCMQISLAGSNQTDLLIPKIKELGEIENYFQLRLYLLKHQKINTQTIHSINSIINKRFKKERQIIVSIESDYDIQEHMRLNIRIDNYCDSFIDEIININKIISSITTSVNAIIIATSDFEEPERYGI